MTEIKNGRYVVNNDIRWYKNNLLHKEDGPALEKANGTKHWIINGMLHRENAPALIYYNGNQCWYIHGNLHREDGPAIEYANGENQWYINNNKMTEEEFNHWLDKKNLNQKLEINLPEKLAIKRVKI